MMVMVDEIKIKEIALRMAVRTEGFKERYFVKELSLDREPRIKVLRGFRGLGKTVALLQLFRKHPTSIYFSVDHPYIRNFSLYELGRSLILNGYTLLLIDEVHYYPGWNKEIKALYDEFPNARFVCSGSAPLAFVPDRRYEILDVEGMSLREMLHIMDRPTLPFISHWQDKNKLIELLAPFPNYYHAYAMYKAGGAFPLYLHYKENTLSAVFNSIRKSIHEDALMFAKLDGRDILSMEKMLFFFATSKLGEFSANSLSNYLDISKYKVYELLDLLERMRILRIIRPYGRGGALVRGEPKIAFHHPVLRAAICEAVGKTPDIGAVREELAVFALSMRGWSVNTIKGRKHHPDYVIEKNGAQYVLEIGGEGKGQRQLKGFKNPLKIDDLNIIGLLCF